MRKLGSESKILNYIKKAAVLIVKTTKTMYLCSVDELRSGYLRDSHLCTLFWI